MFEGGEVVGVRVRRAVVGRYQLRGRPESETVRAFRTEDPDGMCVFFPCGATRVLDIDVFEESFIQVREKHE